VISGPRHTVFWRIVAVLVAAELLVVALTVGLTARFAAQRTTELAATSIESRLDAVAEEVERRAAPLNEQLDLGETLIADLAERFPDPVALVRVDGRVDAFDAPVERPSLLDSLHAFDALVVDISDGDVPGGFAFAPLYDATGIAVGGLLVQPLSASIERELSATRAAARSSVRVVAVVAVVLALVLGGIITWWIVAPIRRISSRVVEIGQGHYGAGVDVPGEHEIGQLARAVNTMAKDVQQSVSRLEEADALRRELLANMGHDIRTPLAGVMAHLEEAERFLHEGRANDAMCSLERAGRSGERVRRLIDDLFELSVLEGHAGVLRREPVLLHELLADVVEDLRPLVPADVRVVLDDPDRESGLGALLMEGDGLRLHRMFSNLVSNALRHARSLVRIHAESIREEGEGRTVSFCVEDDGKGLTAGERERVFERYYRGQDARTKRPDPETGTGLGLAIARAVAEAHGGSIRMDSTPGHGTRVCVQLPLTIP